MKINENFIKLPKSYLFSEVAARIGAYRNANPDIEIIRMDIGDVTLPIPSCVIKALEAGVKELGKEETFHGYGPEQGYSFLREAIAEWDYASRGIHIDSSEIFISDGAKSDLGNLGDIFSTDSVIALCDPGYPVYSDANVMGNRGGELRADGRWSRFVYLPCTEENGFMPEVPSEHADVIYLCSPNNPTGVSLDRKRLEEWVDYARREKALIIYDSAYEAYIDDRDIPRSIYEIEGAKEVAIEVRSFSKTAGFTGLRCGYTVVPAELKGFDSVDCELSLRELWLRRQSTKFNGASYPIQKGAAALYTEEGRKSVRENIKVYKSNATLIKKRMEEIGFIVYGGENSPYIWMRYPGINDSWELFDHLLEKAHISCTPGIGFGRCGAGLIRLTGFNTFENTAEAMRRVKEALMKVRVSTKED